MGHPCGSEFRGVALVLDGCAAWREGLRLPKGAACSSRSWARKSLVRHIRECWSEDLGPTRKVYWIPPPGHTDQSQYSRPKEDLRRHVGEAMVAGVSGAGWPRTPATVAHLRAAESVFFRVVQVQVELRWGEAKPRAAHLQDRHRARAGQRASLRNHLQGRRLVCLGCLSRGHHSRHANVGRRT